MQCSWKPNWAETKRHFIEWWNHDGLVLTGGGPFQVERPHEDVLQPPGPADVEGGLYVQPELRARHNHYALSQSSFPYDNLPISSTDIGPGSLALFLGSEPGFSPETVWFKPCLNGVATPEDLPALAFDSGTRWWDITEDTLRAAAALGDGKYLVGCPDLVENIDILAALRDPQTLLLDMVLRPEWVSEKVWEINEAFSAAYGRIYDIIKQADGGSTFGAFGLWGPGRTAKIQCDACAMFSPDMFDRFVVPAMAAQCEWLDHSMYHLDGHECIVHLDSLLGIDALDAIEWTPDPNVPRGGDPTWYPMYRKILDAGKSVQVIMISPDEVIPLLDAIGGKGVYIATSFESERQAEELWQAVDAYR